MPGGHLMRNVTFAVFLTVFIALDLLAHWYIYARLVRDSGTSGAGRWLGIAAVVALALLVPAGFLLSRGLSPAAARVLAFAGYVWLGTLFYVVLILFVTDVGRHLYSGFGQLMTWLGAEGFDGPPVSPERRAAISQAGAATAVVLAGGAVRSGLAEVDVREVEVKLDRLPPALSGTTLVQLSDVHVGPTIGRAFVASIVQKANDLKPDAVVITGDLVDGPVGRLAESVAPLAELRARYGVFFVTGNHEYYSGVVPWEAHLTKLGIRVLRNERVSVGDGGASFDLAGIDDFSSRGMSAGHGSDIRPVRAGRDPDRELVLLAHQPRSIVDAEAAGAGLVLSGHTHGGQLWPFTAAVRLAQPYVAGLYRHDARTQIYVSRGTGYWGPPMRLFAPSEVTKLVLT